MGTAYLALGSNTGERAELLRQALAAATALPATRLAGCSALYETDPWGYRRQAPFYNAVAALHTGLGPFSLLRRLLTIERRLGRVREGVVRFGPRPVDLDLLVYQGVCLRSARLVLPHPRLTARAFVLVPLAEIAPALRVRGRPVSEWAARCPAAGQVRQVADPGWALTPGGTRPPRG